MQAPVMVMNANAKRETGRKAQTSNIQAAKAVADIIRTTLGPRSMLKMILDPMGGIVMTNDGNAILREIDVAHPAAKSMIELSRTQDEEVGDGTTSVIILSGELLSVAQPFLDRNMHPRHIVGAYVKALDESLSVLDRMCVQLDVNNRESMLSLVRSCIGTKFVSRFGDLVANLAIDAVLRVTIDKGEKGGKEIDIKRYARVEKVPGGMLEESHVLDGVMLNKDVVHPGMRRRIENPRIMLLDCPLEYKKAESQTNLELKGEADFEAVLRQEEDFIKQICDNIIKHKPDIVCTEKGVADLTQHYLAKAGISVLRRLRKTDNNRIARATGATICNVPEEVNEEDIGTRCGLFEVRKIGDEYFAFLEQCREPKACSILLRGASKDVLNEIERNLLDAMSVVRNIVFDPRIVPGGGATEMAIATHLNTKSKSIEGIQQFPFRAVASALEVIPRTLIENCGGNPIKLLTSLRAKHSASQAAGEASCSWGIDGNKGEVADVAAKELAIFEPFMVKSQTIKTSIESACMLLRIDDIVSGMSGRGGGGGGGQPQPGEGQDEETFGDQRDG